jgi:hypothetical protein
LGYRTYDERAASEGTALGGPGQTVAAAAAERRLIPTLGEVRLEGIQTGDMVEVDRLGRRFHALVTGSASSGLLIQPLDRRITYRSCRAREVVTHWAKRGRPRITSEPLEPSPLQLELDTTPRD